MVRRSKPVGVLTMRLSELLVPELVLLPFEASDKWQAIGAMARAPVATKHLDARRLPEVENALKAREKSMTTGMERGIAIPHAAVEGVNDVIAVLGISQQGIPFQALDGQPARIVVCLVIPRQKKLLHIKTLAEIAKLLARASVREQLLACTSPAEVIASVKAAEG